MKKNPLVKLENVFGTWHLGKKSMSFPSFSLLKKKKTDPHQKNQIKSPQKTHQTCLPPKKKKLPHPHKKKNKQLRLSAAFWSPQKVSFG